MKQNTVRWSDWNLNGVDHCLLTESDGILVLEGVVAGTRHGLYGAHYRVKTDKRFCTREVRVEYVGGPAIHLVADGEGHWHDALRDISVADLNGCLDVDIGVTPATNTLPIRRLELKEGESRDITVAYIPLPEQIEEHFRAQRAEQRYTCLVSGRRYLYEGIFRDFSAELEVDMFGVVNDYPDTFRRINTYA